MHENGLTIGQLANAASVNVQTVRYYQRRGLIQQPPKPDAGYRRYPPAALERLRFIKRSQALGFTLREIDHLLELSGSRCADVRDLAQIKRAEIDRRIDKLLRLRQALDEALTACERGDPNAACPLIDALTRDDGSPLDTVP